MPPQSFPSTSNVRGVLPTNRSGARSTATRIGILGLSLATGYATAAAASNFGSRGTAGDSPTGSNSGVWLTNNDYFRVARRGLQSPWREGVRDAVENDYETIPGWDAHSWDTSTCTDSAHDVCAYDSFYGNNGLNGWNSCRGSTSGSHPNQQCSLSIVRINKTYNPPAQRIACHELGHAVGLRHASNGWSCMKRSLDGGTSSWLSDHDRGHLADEY